MKKTTTHPKVSEMKREWYLADANGQVLGRLAARIADTLRGKKKADFSAHLDCGDHVVVINAEKVALTGNKLDQKLYRSHSGYLGNLKSRPARDVLKERPARVIEEAVYGMLPKNKLRKRFMEKLHIYAGTEHKHAGQNPKPITLS